MKLDKKGRQLMGILQQKGRLPLSTLGKQLGMAKETVGYRLKQLKEKNIITSFSINVNAAKIGYIYHKIFIKYSRITPSEEQDIIDYLLSSPGVMIIRVLEGHYDLSFVYISKSFSELRQFLNAFTVLHGEQIIERHILLISKIHNYIHKYFLTKNKWIIYDTLKTETVLLDHIDKKILEEFSKNCRISLIGLAKNTDIKRTTLLYHKRKLEKQKVISSYTGEINIAKLEFICVHLHISLFNIAVGAEVISFFEKTGFCTIVYELIGEYDLSLELLFETNEERLDVMKDFKKRFAKRTLNYDISHVSNTYNGGWTPFSSKK